MLYNRNYQGDLPIFTADVLKTWMDTNDWKRMHARSI